MKLFPYRLENDGSGLSSAPSWPANIICGRRRDRIKGLYWEGDGFILVYKRLERGVYQWPRNEREAKEITPQQYRWLMEGLKVEQPKAHRPVTGLTAI